MPKTRGETITIVVFAIVLFIFFYYRMYETEIVRFTLHENNYCVRLPIKSIKKSMNFMDKKNNGPSV